ncbi:hypothetical protein HDF25_003741 [Pedobacter cryoconitis]|uniref:Uncharacterized protein n=1 Tax=Pedobacter cryoconitis TaxID=188932 RepID=A0A7X0J8D2_9SPHI|nr:hypothetical protein [Pedobacter cryoconitis]
MVIHPDIMGVRVITFLMCKDTLKIETNQTCYIMKKSNFKSLKLEITPVYQISAFNRQHIDFLITEPTDPDPTTATVTFTTKFFNNRVIR